MKKIYYSICILLLSVLFVGFGFIILRLGCKQLLIDRMHVTSEWVCILGNYVWGDKLTTERSKVMVDEITKSERLLELEAMLAEQPLETAEEVYTEKNVLAFYDETCESIKGKLEKYCQENFFFYDTLREIAYKWDNYTFGNMTYAHEANMTYTLKNGVVSETVEKSDLSPYVEEIEKKALLADSSNIPYLYVQYPYRVDRKKKNVPFGVSTYENENASSVLEQLRIKNVQVLDLGEELEKEGWNSYDGFYKTDGHWTTESGFISAGILAQYLNDNFAFKFDMKYFEEENYNVQTYSLNNWSIDEKVEIRIPKFTTNLKIMDAYRNREYEGMFEETWLDKETVETTNYSNVLTAYSGLRVGNSRLLECENLVAVNNTKRVLICSNSFSWHLVPYLSLDCKYINFLCDPDSEKIEYYIRELKPDMIIEMAHPKYCN